MDWFNILERAGWTAVQAAIASITAVPLVTDIEGWQTLSIVGISSGISALLSFIKTVAQERLETL